MLLLIGALTIGLILSLLAFGIFVSFRIFEFADITADGSITLGGAVAAVLIVAGVNPLLATAAAFAAGALAGMTTAVLHTRFHINRLLSGILVMTALYSINLHVMGKSNLPLMSERTLGTMAESVAMRLVGTEAVHLARVGGRHARPRRARRSRWSSPWSSARALYLFFRTNLGTAMQAAGDNAQMIRALGVNVDNMMVLGLAAVERPDRASPARCSRSTRASPTSRWASAWWCGGSPASSSARRWSASARWASSSSAPSWARCCSG